MANITNESVAAFLAGDRPDDAAIRADLEYVLSLLDEAERTMQKIRDAAETGLVSTPGHAESLRSDVKAMLGELSGLINEVCL